MGKFVLTHARLFVGGADLTTVNNKIELACEVEEKDVTAFSADPTTALWAEVIGGLASTSATAEGQWEAGDASRVDDASWAAMGAVGAWTACPVGANVGDLAWLTAMMTGSYALGGQVGEVAPWKADWKGSWPLARGEVLHPPGTARTVTGSGTARQLGALTASQAMYVTVHVLSVSGTTPSITVTVDSDDNSAMTTATTRATFNAATDRGGQTTRVAGAVTDDWWRVSWTISGTSPSFLFLAAAGIGPA